MHRFYCVSQNISGDKITISDKKEIHHIKDVLRLKVKEKVALFDDSGNEYTAEIEKIIPQSISFKIKKRGVFSAAKKMRLTVACAIPKKAKMDEIVDKLTQLGVDRITPLKTERVVVKLDKQKEALRLVRWKKIALSAAEQSQRSNVPDIEPPKDIKEVVSQTAGYDLKIIPTLIGERKNLKEIFARTNPKNILVLIGPEGDFTQEEVELAIKEGFVPVSFGKEVLRVDTAAIAVASFIKLYAQS